MRVFLLLVLLFCHPVFADSFYVSYKWIEAGELKQGWGIGSITTDIDTKEGMYVLIELLQERKNTDNLIIVYLRKLKSNPSAAPQNKLDVFPKTL